MGLAKCPQCGGDLYAGRDYGLPASFCPDCDVEPKTIQPRHVGTIKAPTVRYAFKNTNDDSVQVVLRNGRNNIVAMYVIPSNVTLVLRDEAWQKLQWTSMEINGPVTLLKPDKSGDYHITEEVGNE